MSSFQEHLVLPTQACRQLNWPVKAQFCYVNYSYDIAESPADNGDNGDDLPKLSFDQCYSRTEFKYV